MRVEGVTYVVNWKEFKKGSSFFIPCNHPNEAKKNILKILTRLKLNVATKVVIEEGVKGLRLWKI